MKQNEGSPTGQVLTITEARFLAAIVKKATTIEVMSILNCSESTARRRIKQYRKVMNLPKHKIITVAGFLNYWTDQKVFVIRGEETHLKRA